MNATNGQLKQRSVGAGKLRRWVLGISGFVTLVAGAFFLFLWKSGAGINARVQTQSESISTNTISVSIRNFGFDPPRVEVTKGAVVEWKNIDLAPHTVTSGSFDSSSIATSKLWQHTFEEAGTFSYICTYHPQMKGVVVVK